MDTSSPIEFGGHIPAAAGAGSAPDASGAILFEVSWEACAQVGGIYTVLRSKAPATVRAWEDNYFLIGPYREASARVELEPNPAAGAIQEALAELSAGGVRLHYGRWLIAGRPQVILIDVDSVRGKLGEDKYYFWKDCGISSPDGDCEYDEILLFGYAVADLLAAVQRRLGARPVLAHFHEWQGAGAVPVLRHRQVPVATVFTTHATLVGRSLCAANAQLYDHLSEIDAAAVAYGHGFAHRHAVERAAAQAADVFTTVSGITGLEAERFLGRRPDVLLPNGLNVERFAAPHEFQVLHRGAKEAIHNYVIGHFFPSYAFDLDRTLYVFTAGRYEYRNKGLDVFIEALHELNRRMQADGTTTTVVAFIITRAAHRALNVETLNRQAMFNELKDTCASISDHMGRRLFHLISRGQVPSLDDLLDEYATVRLKRMMYAWRGGPPPTIVTHDLVDDAHDPVLCHLRHRHLLNLEGDRVKVVFHPEFMTVTSPLLGMEYDDFVRGCHLGVFPSYYEPWGYTPLECVVRGIPTITSDLSGFGDYIRQNFPDHDASGMFVARRRGLSFEATVSQVTDWMYALTRMSRRERIAMRNRVEGHAEHFDWNNLGRHYADARRLALAKAHPGRPVTVATARPSAEERPADPAGPAAKRPARRSGRTSRRRPAAEGSGG